MKYEYYSSCVGWDPKDVDGGLSLMVDDAQEITRRTFLKHVDREEFRQLEKDLGYSIHPVQGLTMAQDWHVTYHRSKLHGFRVYYFRHSAIEYVFIKWHDQHIWGMTG